MNKKYLISFLLLFSLLLFATNYNSNPHVIVLGVAQDGGAPHAGCLKECCEERWDNPKKHLKVSSIAIVDPKTSETWIIDATPDFASQLNSVSDNELKGVFLTHAHIGHYTGLMYFGREALGSKGIKVNVLPRMYDFISNNGPWSQLVELGNISLNEINFRDNIKIKPNLSVIPIQVPHRDEFSETSAFLIKGPNKTALFLPDIDKWSKWSISLIEMLENVDYAFIDATF